MKTRMVHPQHPPQRQRRRRDLHEIQLPGAQALVSSNRLEGKCVLITGGDGAVGRAVALACAQEGADVALAYCHELKANLEIRDQIQDLGRRCVLIAGQLDDPEFSRRLVDHAVRTLGSLHVLINNAVDQQQPDATLPESASNLRRTFRTSVFSMFYVTRAALPYLERSGAIINTAFVAQEGSAAAADRPQGEDAIAAFTRSLARGLATRNVRVNGIAFDPTWTPLVPAEFVHGATGFATPPPIPPPASQLVAPCYIFLASEESSELTGQMLHPHGGEIIKTSDSHETARSW
jgi:NAD(P)-dependent dehydrogenase (short-subunit alcohol dehydrogenase family)